MSEPKEKNNKLSIYLIKSGIAYDKVLKAYAYNNTLCENEHSKTYYYPVPAKAPDWIDSYFKTRKEEIFNSHAKVISLHELVIDGTKRIFAIPFGNGKHLLNDDVIEEQFGLKVLLNSVSKSGFRQITASNYSDDHRTKNEQTPKKTDITDFGFDIYNDLLRKATAKSEDEMFNNNTITGGEAITVCVPRTIENVDEFIIECYRKYQSDKYKTDFKWIDNIKEVKEKELKNQLNEELVQHINNRDFERVWMAIPEVIEWEKVKDFRFKTDQDGYDDIDLESFLKFFKSGKVNSVDTLKIRKVYAMEQDSDDPLYVWTVYNCLIAEIDFEGGTYCLNFGKWYKINKDYVSEINDYYNKIPISSIEFPNCVDEKEDEYNEKLHLSLDESILMDKKTVQLSGMGYSKIEVCDVLSKNKELIHVKKNGGSSYLSHLFNQAAVSGEMLLSGEFRNEANAKIQKVIFENDFRASDYTIILAIITRYNTERPHIPFFSKVAIRYAIDGLTRKNYMVKIKNIFDERIN